VAGHAAGNEDAKNWQDEARKIIEHEVSNISYLRFLGTNSQFQMEKYWKNQPQAASRVLLINKKSGNVGSASVSSNYD
jgi:endo-alpha-1,4-polygalactosaminidase (GH114 family)